jgi:ABC-type Fe3+/spermidine/putrescine transport system ATPase subunit
MSATMLELEGIEKRFGQTVTAEGISLELARGEFFTLLGPSGSGKSTILRIIAGLEAPDSGRVLVEGKDVTDLPPWRRGLGMVFQSYANFPHMTVAENVAYGLKRQKLGSQEMKQRVGELLDLVGLADFEGRRVTQLSGGEQQRVAIARALAPTPGILLLDEPLSALDEKIRREMQGELRSIQRRIGTTFIYVTHDQEEALTMSDRIAVLNRGLCVQCDIPERIFRRPRTRFVANFFRGCNVLEGDIRDSGRELIIADGRLRLREAGPEGSHAIALRGEDLLIGDSAANADLVLEARLESVTYRGVYTDYRLELSDGQQVSAMLGKDLNLSPGSATRVGLDASKVTVLEED